MPLVESIETFRLAVVLAESDIIARLCHLFTFNCPLVKLLDA